MALRWSGIAVPPHSAGGTLWQGSLQLDPAHAVEWQTAWGRSLVSGALVADLSLQAPGSALQGEVRARPAQIALEFEGTAAWPLVSALGPQFPLRCDTSLTLRLAATLATGLRTAEGRGTSTAGTCARFDGTVGDVPLPALTYRVTTDPSGVVLRIDTDAIPAEPMAEARLTPDDRVQVTLRQAAAALIPGLPAGGDFALDLPLSVMLP